MPSKYGFDNEEYDSLKTEKAVKFAKQFDSKIQDILKDFLLSLSLNWEHDWHDYEYGPKHGIYIDSIVPCDVEIKFESDNDYHLWKGAPVWRVSFNNSNKVSQYYNHEHVRLDHHLMLLIILVTSESGRLVLGVPDDIQHYCIYGGREFYQVDILPLPKWAHLQKIIEQELGIECWGTHDIARYL